MGAPETRAAAVAGLFYPEEPAALRATVREALTGAPRDQQRARAPKAAIVPHAGYVYSGPVAASVYARLAPLRGRIQRVVLLGPCHRVAVRGLAGSAARAFETPIGEVPLDREALAQVEHLPQVQVLERAHAGEHSLEVQLPFLIEVLGEGFALVPFAVGDASTEEVAEVLGALWGGDETLLLVSSDLSHYHEYETARRLDAATTRAIEALDPDALGRESACGRVPIRGLLRAARDHGLRCETLDLRSSGDTAGPRDRVVGYGGYVFA